MRRGKWAAGMVCAALGLAAWAADQSQIDLVARQRVFADYGNGLTAIKRDAKGRYAILTARGPLVILDAEGKRLGEIPASGSQPAAAGQPASTPAFIHADDFDYDAEGRVFIADRGANKVRVYSSAGVLERTVEVSAPSSLVALAEGEVAVASAWLGTAREPLPRAVSVFDAKGRLARQFGAPVELAERRELNRVLNLGRLAPGPRGQLFYAFTYLPEPTVRKYDRFGFGVQDFIVQSLEFLPMAQAMRREIAQQDKRRTPPSLKPIITGFAVDPESEELWIAMGNLLLHLDREGNPRGSYRAYTPEGARFEPTLIVVEAKRLLLANDPSGIFEFPRPDQIMR